MKGERAKQRLKNGVYRALGETTSTLTGANGGGDDRLRVLMYHKVNDRPANPLTVPVSLLDEQLAQLGELGYTVVDLDAVLDHYRSGVPLPRQPVLLTFDDGYRDNLENAAPLLRKYGYPAVLFVPVDYLDAAGVLPHEEALASRGVLNPTLRWEELPEVEAAGIRVESHGLSHRVLAELEPAEAEHELEASKRLLEERLGRPVRAYAYVKGSEAHYRPEHVSLVRSAGYELAFTSVSGANDGGSNPLRLRRYNVEPYPARTFELVLAGACDLIRIKDSVAGTQARRLLNSALGTTST
jgi:peptidoglycan/xylan/chitin deacetylase (PgdA/CDA1 family)